MGLCLYRVSGRDMAMRHAAGTWCGKGAMAWGAGAGLSQMPRNQDSRTLAFQSPRQTKICHNYNILGGCAR
ncbi:hypothetical protein STA1M1_40710 [Sinisalibacter aestuarii]|uniref:Uncharacterized protein n=1 Tax=Sinisalibacter aestuarii TaxID=2949426 RepID=A0ABQ5M0Q3_9RHOB|nr:hypothetical protein STA1M1_40710 [Sinisalibacter aestuarii]